MDAKQEARIKALEARVEELEGQRASREAATAAGSEWTGDEAIDLVKREFQASAKNCSGEPAWEARVQCFRTDPVLAGVTPLLVDMPTRFWGGFLGLLVEPSYEASNWSAEAGPEPGQWRVELNTFLNSDNRSLVFYIDEHSHAVSGKLE